MHIITPTTRETHRMSDKSMMGCAITFYPFCWRLGLWHYSGCWLGAVGPFGFVLSLQRTWSIWGDAPDV
jgi:hypothetical protein